MAKKNVENGQCDREWSKKWSILRLQRWIFGTRVRKINKKKTKGFPVLITTSSRLKTTTNPKRQTLKRFHLCSRTHPRGTGIVPRASAACTDVRRKLCLRWGFTVENQTCGIYVCIYFDLFSCLSTVCKLIYSSSYLFIYSCIYSLIYVFMYSLKYVCIYIYIWASFYI